MPEPPLNLKANREVVLQLTEFIIAEFEKNRKELVAAGTDVTPLDQLMVAHNFHKGMVLGACKLAPNDFARLKTLHIASVTWVEMIMREMDKIKAQTSIEKSDASG